MDLALPQKSLPVWFRLVQFNTILGFFGGYIELVRSAYLLQFSYNVVPLSYKLVYKPH